MNLNQAVRALRINLYKSILLRRAKTDLALNDSIVIIAPHPDDEIMGCGALIQRAVSMGKKVDVVLLTSGEKSHHGCCTFREIKKNRERLTDEVFGFLNFPSSSIHRLKFADGSVAYQDKESVDDLFELLNRLNPGQIFIPHRSEIHPDHVRVYGLMDIYKKRFSAKFSCYEYIVWAWYRSKGKYDWGNSYILQMTPDEHAIKGRCIDMYTQELASCGKPWAGILPDLLLKFTKWDKEVYFYAKELSR